MINLKKNINNNESERGVISVYMALTVVIVMVTSTLILTGVITRQFQSVADVEFTERAFYAASSGLEHASYLIQRGDPDVTINASQEIEYAGEPANYKVEANFDVNEDNQITAASICSNGHFRSVSRRLVLEQGLPCN